MSRALLIIAHGGRNVKATEKLLAYYIGKLSPDFDIVKGCVLESIGETFSSIDSNKVYVMPLFVAEGYHTRVSIPEAIESAGKEVVYLPPLGESEHIVRLIKDRVKNA